MAKKLLVTGIVFCLVSIGIQAAGATFETERLVIRDITGNISSERFEKLVNKVDSTLTKILQFWATEPRIKQFGKIIVEFDNSDPKANYSFFFFRKENGQRVRVVRVSGGDEYPHHLAHKLTSAVFPNPDKLIRNMMGEASEIRFGNPLSFPMCGFDNDCWVIALSRAGSYIPLSKIGTNHSDWGMEIDNNVPKVKDRAKQHASYLEAGSFGEFLINTYGIEKMKQFNLLSRNKPRPWEEVFGIALEQLEAKWLEALRLRSREKEEKISTLVKLLKDNPNTACSSAQDLTKEK
ncbi:MAG: hypothetical protein NTX75_02610 [Proteobacteria bacterium]|nr:hypothetical protein [Pseudomonadota bacterium]